MVPAFNEAQRLPDGFDRLAAAVMDGCVDLDRTEVLVVDDGSTDGTAAVAEALVAGLPHHRVHRSPVNRGKGAAVRTGIALARSPLVAHMDADMAIDPRAVPSLLDGLAATEIAIGSRALAESMVESRYLMRSLMGRSFNRLVTLGTTLHLSDTQCGFKAYRTPVARLLFHLVRIERFAFDVEVLTRARRLGLDITEVPVHWKHVDGSSIHPARDSLTMLADVMRSRLGLGDRPPVPALAVPHRQGSTDPDAAAVADALSRVTGDTPQPVIDTPTATVVLLPLLDSDELAATVAGLRAEFDGLALARRSYDLAALLSLGPLAGRIRCAHSGRPPG